MLILTRKLNESVIIDGRIAVKILRIDKDQVKLGIVAPTEVGVHRWEIFEAIQSGQQRRAAPSRKKRTPTLYEGPKRMGPSRADGLQRSADGSSARIHVGTETVLLSAKVAGFFCLLRAVYGSRGQAVRAPHSS